MTHHTPGDCEAVCPLGTITAVEAMDTGDGVSRRTFISRAALAAATIALAACGAGDATGPSFSGTFTLILADYPALASVNGVALVTANGARIAVVRSSSSAFVALSRTCPHEGGLINQSGSGFLCSRHGAQFSLTGTWQGGERTSSMRSYATSYNPTAGTVTIG